MKATMSAQQLKEFIRATLNELENAVRNEKWTLVQFNAANIARAASIVELEERQDEAGIVSRKDTLAACLGDITGVKL